MLSKRMHMKESKRKKAERQELATRIEAQLSLALDGWREQLGEKKFRKRISRLRKSFGRKLELPKTSSTDTTIAIEKKKVA